MALAPALFKHLPDILWVQVHVHGPVRRVDMADLAIAAHVERVSREQGEAVLLKTRCGRDKLLRQSRAERFNGRSEPVVGMQRARLVQLALWGKAGNVWPRTRAIG